MDRIKNLIIALIVMMCSQVALADEPQADGYQVELKASINEQAYFYYGYEAEAWCEKFNSAFENSCTWQRGKNGLYKSHARWERAFIGYDRYSRHGARSDVLQQVLNFLANDNIAAIIQLILLQFLN